MKKSILVLTLGCAIVACSSGVTEENATGTLVVPTVELAEGTTETGMLTADVAVGGMSCEMGCVGAIKNKFAGMEGVTTVEFPDFDGAQPLNHAIIQYDADLIKGEDLAVAIQEIGGGLYKVDEVRVGFDVETEAPVQEDVENASDDQATSGSGESEGSAVVPTTNASFPNPLDLLSGLFSAF